MNTYIVTETFDSGFNWGLLVAILAYYLGSFIAICFALVEKVDVWKKVQSIFIVVFLPILGWIVYWIIRYCRALRKAA